MSLTELWQRSPEQLRGKRIHQIITFAGDGSLRDGNAASVEFREYLTRIPSEQLAAYAEECLSDSFNGSGHALQDLVNQVGRRLGFEVTYGRYRGTKAHLGFDGLWYSPAGHHIIVEVKTSDVYRLSLDTIGGYRKALIQNNTTTESESSALIVVGRHDTGDLEAQIRGSRHAWDIRLISVDALLRLMSVKEDLEDPEILQRIHRILVPREFTRLDEIVDVLFTTAEDLKQEDEPTEETTEDEIASKKFTPVAFHRACVDRIAPTLGVQFVKQSRASFYSNDGEIRLVCAVSRQHERSGLPAYWFAFHPHQQNFLTEASQSYIAFGCGSSDRVLLMPFEDFEPYLEGLHITDRGDRHYWHVPIQRIEEDYTLLRRKGLANVDLTQYTLK